MSRLRDLSRLKSQKFSIFCLFSHHLYFYRFCSVKWMDPFWPIWTPWVRFSNERNKRAEWVFSYRDFYCGYLWWVTVIPTVFSWKAIKTVLLLIAIIFPVIAVFRKMMDIFLWSRLSENWDYKFFDLKILMNVSWNAWDYIKFLNSYKFSRCTKLFWNFFIKLLFLW